VTGEFQGRSCPDSSASTPSTSTQRICHSIAPQYRRRPTRREEFAEWVAERGPMPASVPVWTSRRGWISVVAQWADTEEGQQSLRTVHVSVRRFTAVVRALALFADGSTGRNVAVTNARVARLAGVSERLVTTARKVLAEADLAVEAQRGYGMRHGRRNRPSIWHLVSRRRAVCDLPRSTRPRNVSSVWNNSPNARARRRKLTHKKIHSQPRPLHVQRLAAHLAENCVGMRTAHPGHWAGVLERSHLRTTEWSGKQLVAAMNATMKEHGWHWPDRPVNPVGFLTFRISQLPEVPPTPERAPARPACDRDELQVPASAEVRATQLARIRAVLAAARRNA
jgi:hypothetical protein